MSASVKFSLRDKPHGFLVHLSLSESELSVVRLVSTCTAVYWKMLAYWFIDKSVLLFHSPVEENLRAFPLPVLGQQCRISPCSTLYDGDIVLTPCTVGSWWGIIVFGCQAAAHMFAPEERQIHISPQYVARGFAQCGYGLVIALKAQEEQNYKQHQSLATEQECQTLMTSQAFGYCPCDGDMRVPSYRCCEAGIVGPLRRVLSEQFGNHSRRENIYMAVVRCIPVTLLVIIIILPSGWHLRADHRVTTWNFSLRGLRGFFLLIIPHLEFPSCPPLFHPWMMGDRRLVGFIFIVKVEVGWIHSPPLSCPQNDAWGEPV